MILNPIRRRPSFSADFPARLVTRAGGFYPEPPVMAGDWIKMRHDLADDPAVIILAAETDCVDADHVVGKLHKLWSWADRQSRTGRDLGATPAWVDTFLECPGFAKVLQKIGWLGVSKSKRKSNLGGIFVPNFDHHMSQSAKIRALSARRKVTERSRNQRDKTATRGEKRREEKRRGRETPLSPSDTEGKEEEEDRTGTPKTEIDVLLEGVDFGDEEDPK